MSDHDETAPFAVAVDRRYGADRPVRVDLWDEETRDDAGDRPDARCWLGVDGARRLRDALAAAVCRATASAPATGEDGAEVVG